MLKEHWEILLGCLKEFKNTGTFFPSSRWAAEALTSPLRRSPGNKTIVEVGAGTGPVTERILADMKDGDRLTIVELNPKLMQVLRVRLEKNRDYYRHRENVRLFEGAIQDLPEDWKYDVIVCALPFLNFDIDLTQDIFDKLHRISTDDAVMTWYEYIGLRTLGKVVSPSDRKIRLHNYELFFNEMRSRVGFDRERVWLNLLPINIYTMRMAA